MAEQKDTMKDLLLGLALKEANELTCEEILLILDKLAPRGGYSEDPKILRIQGKLSITLEVRRRMGKP